MPCCWWAVALFQPCCLCSSYVGTAAVCGVGHGAACLLQRSAATAASAACYAATTLAVANCCNQSTTPHTPHLPPCVCTPSASPSLLRSVCAVVSVYLCLSLLLLLLVPDWQPGFGHAHVFFVAWLAAAVCAQDTHTHLHHTAQFCTCFTKQHRHV